MCRGVFGCHTALVLRRLRRLCHYQYHCSPTFVITSATVANPESHVKELLGEPSRVQQLNLRQGCRQCCTCEGGVSVVGAAAPHLHAAWWISGHD